MKRFIFSLSLCCMVCLMVAQVSFAGALWDKYFGTTDKTESTMDICGLNDWEPINYVAVGYQQSNGQYSAYIIKINNNGIKTGETTYRGLNGNQDCIAHSVVKYSDNYGTYVVVAGTIANNGQWDVFAVTYRVNGDQFEKIRENACVGRNGNNISPYRSAWDIVPYYNNGANDFFLTGETDDYKMYALHLKNDLQVRAAYVYGGGMSSTAGYSLYYDNVYNYLYAVGKGVKQDGNTQALLVWLVPNGEWISFYGEAEFGGAYKDIGYSIAKGPYNGTLTIAGKYGQSSSNSDYWFLTVTTSWPSQEVPSYTKKWGSTTLNEELNSIERTDNGNYVVAGKKDIDPNPSIQYYTYLSGRYSNGNQRWVREYGNPVQNSGTGLIRTTYRNRYVGVASNASPGAGMGDAYVIRYYD
jgi:hypothetical protein